MEAPLFGERTYNIHVPIDHNLPTAASITEALEALSNLEEIIDDAFARISTRIKFCRGQIDNMSSRIGPCEKKIRYISERGAKKATTVFSYSKYPSTEKIRLKIFICCGWLSLNLNLILYPQVTIPVCSSEHAYPLTSGGSILCLT